MDPNTLSAEDRKLILGIWIVFLTGILFALVTVALIQLDQHASLLFLCFPVFGILMGALGALSGR